LDTEKFTYLLAHPEEITTSDVISLELLLHRYPFFQTARALQLKGLKDQNSYRYNEALKLTAAHTSDRDILFQFITSDEFIQNTISSTIIKNKTQIEDFEVVFSDISDEVKDEKIFESEKQKAAAILDPDLFERKGSDSEDVRHPEEQPLTFTKKDKYSFSEWLKLSRAQPIHRDEAPSDLEESSSTSFRKETRHRQSELIEKFIQEKPKIIPDAAAAKPDVTFQKFLNEGASQESLMTETLAKVYLQQKNYQKAIQAYKILILKYPEKSGFFADQIRAIEKLINPEQS